MYWKKLKNNEPMKEKNKFIKCHPFMKLSLYITLIVFFTACGSTSTDKSTAEPIVNKQDTIAFTSTHSADSSAENNQPEDTTDYNYATYFVIVADTSPNYYLLHKKMFNLALQLSLPIDTMGRYYNKTKNIIALPDDDEDEIYAGGYFPRRFPSQHLSLEYLHLYQKIAGENTMALVTGIYETETSADSALTLLKQKEKNGFKVKANMYVGCMH
jgi:hypothetical protein